MAGPRRRVPSPTGPLATTLCAILALALTAALIVALTVVLLGCTDQGGAEPDPDISRLGERAATRGRGCYTITTEFHGGRTVFIQTTTPALSMTFRAAGRCALV